MTRLVPGFPNVATRAPRRLARRLAILLVPLLAACDMGREAAAAPPPERRAPHIDGQSLGIGSAEAHWVATIGDLHAPESVRYDADEDAFYISNIVGFGSVKDGNGYIVRVSASDPGQSRVLVRGGANGATLHAPKGLAIVGDTLWVADIDALRGFHRRTGVPLRTIDFAPLGVVLLNDVAVGPEGEVRVTDTGIRMTHMGIWFVGPARIFALGRDGAIRTVGAGPAIGQPNGIAWDPAGRRWIVVSFDRFAWEVKTLPASGDSSAASDLFTRATSGRLEGVVVLPSGDILYTSWSDSSLHLLGRAQDHAIVRGLREPADIGIDTRRGRVAIPMPIAGVVQLWSLDSAGRAQRPGGAARCRPNARPGGFRAPTRRSRR